MFVLQMASCGMHAQILLGCGSVALTITRQIPYSDFVNEDSVLELQDYIMTTHRMQNTSHLNRKISARTCRCRIRNTIVTSHKPCT